MSIKAESATSIKGEHINVLKGYHSLGFLTYRLAFSSVLSGFCIGYDCGIISNAMLYIVYNRHIQPVTSLWNSAFLSIPTGVAAVTSLFSSLLADRFGRKLTILLSCLIEVIGCLTSALSFSKATLLIGRMFLGLALGLSSAAVPIYVGESSPAKIRGLLVTCFQLMITFGFLISSVVAGIFSYWDPVTVGWRFMVGFSLIPASIEFICLFKLPESPRWLFSRGNKEFAVQILHRLYGTHESANTEIAELSESYEKERVLCQFTGGKRKR